MIKRWGEYPQKSFTNPKTQTASAQNMILDSGESEAPVEYLAISYCLPGHSVNFHMHDEDVRPWSELFIIVDGDCCYNDDGLVHTIRQGDAGYCTLGEGHGVCNPSEGKTLILAEMGLDPRNWKKEEK